MGKFYIVKLGDMHVRQLTFPASVFESQASSPVSTEYSREPTKETGSEKSSSSSKTVAQSRDEVASALEEWQKRFSTAAGRGAEDLRERVKNIVDDEISSGALTRGANLALELENAVGDQISAIKLQVNNSIASLPFENSPVEEETARNELSQAVRQAAISIRDRTHALRGWYSALDQKLSNRVASAVDSTLHVLDSIRDLGLQDVGMRWTRADAVTFEDWGKYHSIKSQFDDWREEVARAGIQHEKLEETRALGLECLDHGMEVAETAAKELPRLKEAGNWKIAAHELSDNFETRSEPPPPLSKPVDESDQESVESISDSNTDALETPSDSESPHVAGPSATEKVPSGNNDYDEPSAESQASNPEGRAHHASEEAEATQATASASSSAAAEEI